LIKDIKESTAIHKHPKIFSSTQGEAHGTPMGKPRGKPPRMHAEEAEMKHQVQLLHSRAIKATMNYGYPATEQVPHNVEEHPQWMSAIGRLKHYNG